VSGSARRGPVSEVEATRSAAIHRLWYDLRSQSLFEEAFRDDVAEIDGSLQDMIWRLVRAYADLTGTQPTASSRIVNIAR
jgi:hypothetical protein